MPTRQKIAARKTVALNRIEQGAAEIEGAKALNFKIRHRNNEMKELLMLEQFAEWVETLAGAQETTVSGDIPLDYLTTDGLRWLAEQRGIDVSEAKTKAEIIELIEG